MKSIDYFRLDGKCAIVTGTASPTGLGAAVSEAFAEAGCNVVLADIKDASKVAEDIRKKTGTKTLAVKVDIRSDESVQNMLDAAVKAFGKVDILVNNAGTTWPHPVHTVDMDIQKHFQDVLDVNVVGTLRCTKYIAKHMIENGIKGSIINTSSTAGLRATGPQGGHAYSTTKAAIIMLTKCWALEFAQYGIRVNTVAPGFVHTDLTYMWHEKPETLKWINAKVPMNRMAEPDELKGSFLYLASDASDFVTGTVLVADGGLNAISFHSPMLRPEDFAMYK